MAAAGTTGNGTAPADGSAPPGSALRPVLASEVAAMTQQQSYSGTPRWPDGTTHPDDYARDMVDPVRRMEIFEEMRSSDDAVHAAIDSRRQEINSANWVISTEDKSSRGNEILQFCEDNIYPVLDDILRWLGGGALQYGFGSVEPIYAWADRAPAGTITRGNLRRAAASTSRGLYLTKVAHLRQRTVYTFKITELGDLESVVQWVYTGTEYRRVEIAPNKLLLWTYDRQGDDRWGVPPTRHCHKAWTFKQQIEKLNLLHIDRFGVGLPVVEEGEGWGALERDRMAAFLKTWRSGGQNYLMHPQGGSIAVESDDGKTTMSMLEWVKYYNLQIAKTYLTQQTELGSTNTGARALGESFVEGMKAFTQADCEELAALINERLIKNLVDWNFGAQLIYPLFEPSQRVNLQGGVATMLQQLIASKAIHPRPEDEAFLRDAFGLPTVDVKTLQGEQDQRDVAAKALADAQAQAAADAAKSQPGAPAPPADPSTADPSNADPSKQPPPPRPALVAASRSERGEGREPAIRELALALADGAPDPAEPYVSTYRTREYSQWEQGVVRPDVLGRDLDLQTTRLAAEVQDVLKLIDAELEAEVATHANDSAATLAAAVRTIAVSDKLRSQLRGVMLAAAYRARAYGATAVRLEAERQAGPLSIDQQRSTSDSSWFADVVGGASFYSRIGRGMLKRLRALAAGDAPAQMDAKQARDLRLEAQVDGAVESEIDRREQGARSAILSALTQAAAAVPSLLSGVVATSVKNALLGLSVARTESNIGGVVNVGFGIGRTDMAETITPTHDGIDTSGGGGRSGITDANGSPIEFVGKIYSAVMDFGTCDECAKWDGAEFPIDYPDDISGVQCPNPRCYGTEKKCRCIWIYLTSRESVPIVPASKGPIAFTADERARLRELMRHAGEEHTHAAV